MKLVFAAIALTMAWDSPPAHGLTLGELKTAATLRAEAARYDEAVKAINGIASMRIATLADFANARKLYQAHAPNLGYASSRMVVLGYEDKRYTAAVFAQLTTASAAQAFAQRLAADRSFALRFDGATELQSRMTTLLRTNAGILQRALDAMHAASLRLAGRGPAVQPKFFSPPSAPNWNLAVPALFSTIATTLPATLASSGSSSSGGSTGLYEPDAAALAAFRAMLAMQYSDDQLLRQLIELAMAGAAARTSVIDAMRQVIEGTEQACKDRAKVKYDQCLAEAARLPEADRPAATEACEWERAAARSLCEMGFGSLGNDSGLFGFSTP